MRRQSRQRIWCGVACVYALVVAGVLAGVPGGARSPSGDALPANGLIVDRDDNIFDNQAAADLAAEARQQDTFFSAGGDRETAAKLYAQAIAAQPGAKSNAMLANRMAQRYGFNMPTDPQLAIKWWTQCLEYTDDKQLLWGEAHMGMASMYSILGEHEKARVQYEQILTMDPSKLELPRWKDWSNPRMAAEMVAEKAREQEGLAYMQRTATERLAVLKRIEIMGLATSPPPKVEVIVPKEPPASVEVDVPAPVEADTQPHAAEVPLAQGVAGSYNMEVIFVASLIGAVLGGVGILWAYRRKRG